MIAIKYAAKRFAQMDDDERMAFTVGTILRMSVITGWKLPDEIEMQNILYEQFSLHMRETWGSYNPEEVMYAVRHYGSEINDWGKSLNLKMIDQLMNKFAAARIEASKLEEQERNKIDQSKQLPANSGPVNWSETWDELKQKALTIPVDKIIVPLPLYDWLVEQGVLELDKEEKWELYRHAKILYSMELQESGIPADRAKHFVLRSPEWEKHADLKLAVANRAKQLAVRRLLQTETF